MFISLIHSAAAEPYAAWLTDIRMSPTEEPKYTAAIITPRSRDDSPFSKMLADQAYDWIYEEYKRRYPQIDPAIFDKMKGLDTPLDGRSIFGVVFTKGDPKDIKATLRFTFPSREHPLLPMEEYFQRQNLNWKYPRPKIAAGPYQLMLLDRQHEFLGLAGNVLELKNFVTQEHAEDRLVPILFHLVEESASAQSIQTSGKYYNHIPLPEVAAKIKSSGDIKPQAYEIDRNHLRTGLNLAEVNPLDTFPAEYTIECDRRMVPYYRRLGFKLVNPDPIIGDTFVLSMDRKAFVEVGRKFRNQPGGTLVTFEHISTSEKGVMDDLLSKLRSGPNCLRRHLLRYVIDKR